MKFKSKICSRCKKRKPFKRFSPDKTNLDGLYYVCKDCGNRYRRQTRQIPKYKKKEQNAILLKKYGITLNEQKALLVAQGNRCAICRTKRPGGKYNRWQTDHDHKSKVVRGLLCYRCNCALGLLRDSVTLLLLSVIYLRNTNENYQSII